MASTEHSGGLFGSVRRVADACLSGVHNRVELLAVELQEEKFRLVRLLLWTGAALFSIFLAITIITMAIVIAFPDHRLLTLILFGVLYTGIAAGTCVKLRNEMKDAPPPLADTVAELKKDVESLRSKD